MDNGVAAKRFYTKGFTFDVVHLLVSILHYNFGLVCSVQNHNGQSVILIKTRQLFKKLVTPYFDNSIKYKLSDL